MSQLNGKNELCEEIFVPECTLKEAAQVVSNLLMAKSKSVYEKEYATFCEWGNLKNIKGVNEAVLSTYFSEKSKKKASSLWSYYSMLKVTLSVKENVDISKFSKLLVLLKKLSAKYKPKEFKVLEREDINRFLAEAPDEQYLFII